MLVTTYQVNGNPKNLIKEFAKKLQSSNELLYDMVFPKGKVNPEQVIIRNDREEVSVTIQNPAIASKFKELLVEKSVKEQEKPTSIFDIVIDKLGLSKAQHMREEIQSMQENHDNDNLTEESRKSQP